MFCTGIPKVLSVRHSVTLLHHRHKNPCVLVLTRCHMLARASHRFAYLHYGLTRVTYVWLMT